MDNTQFWKIVDEINWKEICLARRGYNGAKKKLVASYTLQEMEEFTEIAGNFRGELYRVLFDEVKGLSDDSYGDFISHIVGMGESEYKKCLEDPAYAVSQYQKIYRENFFYCFPSKEDYQKVEPDYQGFYDRAKKILEALRQAGQHPGDFCHNNSQANIHLNYLISVFDQFMKNGNYPFLLGKSKEIIDSTERIKAYIDNNAADLPHRLFMTNLELRYAEWVKNGQKGEEPRENKGYGYDIFHNLWIIKNLISDIQESRS